METLSNYNTFLICSEYCHEAGMIPAGWSDLQPVCKDSKGAIPLDDTPHHADLLRSEELQR